MMNTFYLKYRVTVLDKEHIDEKIEGICLEQSIELPRTLLEDKIEAKVVGKLSSKKQVGDNIFEVAIRWPFENVGNDISQFLNVLYGNISLQPGIRVLEAEWNSLNGTLFEGPEFGIDLLRKEYDIRNRALSCTALKPLGTDAANLGNLCHEFAAGGVDIIKDDHGISNQTYAPFRERVKECVAGIQKAAEGTGRRSYYFPNVTALADEAVKRYQIAADLGADGVLICPHITGLETMHQMARMDISLPIISHPAFSGGLTTHKERGLAPRFLYGELWRALGADFIIYPNTGGRFSFTLEECKAINKSARSEKIPFNPSFPMPGGGMKRSTIPHWLETYGPDTVFLLGTSLYEHPGGPRAAAKELSGMLK